MSSNAVPLFCSIIHFVWAAIGSSLSYWIPPVASLPFLRAYRTYNRCRIDLHHRLMFTIEGSVHQDQRNTGTQTEIEAEFCSQGGIPLSGKSMEPGGAQEESILPIQLG